MARTKPNPGLAGKATGAAVAVATAPRPPLQFCRRRSSRAAAAAATAVGNTVTLQTKASGTGLVLNLSASGGDGAQVVAELRVRNDAAAAADADADADGQRRPEGAAGLAAVQPLAGAARANGGDGENGAAARERPRHSPGHAAATEAPPPGPPQAARSAAEVPAQATAAAAAAAASARHGYAQHARDEQQDRRASCFVPVVDRGKPPHLAAATAVLPPHAARGAGLPHASVGVFRTAAGPGPGHQVPRHPAKAPGKSPEQLYHSPLSTIASEGQGQGGGGGEAASFPNNLHLLAAALSGRSSSPSSAHAATGATGATATYTATAVATATAIDARGSKGPNQPPGATATAKPSLQKTDGGTDTAKPRAPYAKQSSQTNLI